VYTEGNTLNEYVFSAIICPWLNFGFPPRCPPVGWCHLGEINQFSAALGQNRLAERNHREKSLEILCQGQELNQDYGQNSTEKHPFPPSYLSWWKLRFAIYRLQV